MEWIWPALAMVLVVEGIGPLFFPRLWQKYLFDMSQQPTNQLRQIGGVLVMVGVVCLAYLT